MTDDGPDTDTLVQVHETRIDALADYTDELNDYIETLETALDEQAERIRDLEQLVDPDPGSTPYDQLSKDQKVNHLRQHLVDVGEAEANGKTSMQYREVKALFDGHPSPGHCYDLMRAAAALDGFQYDSNSGWNKRVRVDIEAVKDDRFFHAANKDRGSEAV